MALHSQQTFNMIDSTPIYDNIVVAMNCNKKQTAGTIEDATKNDTNHFAEEIIQYPNTLMFDEDGAMRMRPGWEGIWSEVM